MNIIVKTDHVVTGSLGSRFVERPSPDEINLMNVFEYFPERDIQIAIVGEAFILTGRKRTFFQFFSLQEINVIRGFESL